MSKARVEAEMRKNEKSKDRKAAREEEARMANHHWKKVEKANEVADPLESFVSFKTFKKNDLNLKLSCVRRADMSEELIQWVFDLTKNNMETMYTETWGWNDKSKRREINDERMWFMLAKDENDKAVAFSSFRFDIDYSEPVVYCYEIQLEKSVQRNGLGKFMMQVLQLFAIKFRMHKVVVTVLECNDTSMEFFTKKLKYVCDPSTPVDECYSILCKTVPRKKASTEEEQLEQ